MGQFFGTARHHGFVRTDFVSPARPVCRARRYPDTAFGNEKPTAQELFGNEVGFHSCIWPGNPAELKENCCRLGIIPKCRNTLKFEDGDKVSLLNFGGQYRRMVADWVAIKENTAQEEDFAFFFLELQKESSILVKFQQQPMMMMTWWKRTATAADFIKKQQTWKNIFTRGTVILEFGHQPSELPRCNEIEFHTKEQPSFNR